MRSALIGAAVLIAALWLGGAEPVCAQEGPIPPERALSGVVNVNVADSEQLKLLPGVGPAKAQAILEYRKTKGPFKKVEDLLGVSGIGERALERMRPYVVLEGKTTAQPKDAKDAKDAPAPKR
jgi:competence ComEA-like helix-hairpin-helix protein